MELNLFYEEPEGDRWLPYDRYPRRFIRRVVRGKPQPGGVMRWFLNLRSGLDQLGVKYTVNDYARLRRTPGAWACVVGKPHVVEKIPAGHPIIYGPGVSSHPLNNDFWNRADIRLLLISCEWFRQMYEQGLPRKIPTAVWAAGIETEKWKPASKSSESGAASMGKMTDFLIYDKVRWEHDRYENELLQPIRADLNKRGLSFKEIRYGFYREEEFHRLLSQCRAMIFLCEHETQGFAYQQTLSCGVPILAWERGGFWQDPEFYPHRVKFAPVSAMPYWDDRCGLKFEGSRDFAARLDEFIEINKSSAFRPRDYILENLTLEKCAREYVRLVESVAAPK